MHVTPRGRSVGRCWVDEIHPAEVAGAVVDHDQLAMVPAIEQRQMHALPQGKAERMKHMHAAPSGFEFGERSDRSVVRSDGVDHEPHVDPIGRTSYERLQDACAVRIVPQNVRLNPDPLLRRLDVGQHIFQQRLELNVQTKVLPRGVDRHIVWRSAAELGGVLVMVALCSVGGW